VLVPRAVLRIWLKFWYAHTNQEAKTRAVSVLDHSDKTVTLTPKQAERVD
jgi:hypothetical protein